MKCFTGEYLQEDEDEQERFTNTASDITKEFTPGNEFELLGSASLA